MISRIKAKKIVKKTLSMLSKHNKERFTEDKILFAEVAFSFNENSFLEKTDNKNLFVVSLAKNVPSAFGRIAQVDLERETLNFGHLSREEDVKEIIFKTLKTIK